MAEREILLLGNPALYQACPVTEDEIDDLETVITDLRDTMMALRRRCAKRSIKTKLGP